MTLPIRAANDADLLAQHVIDACRHIASFTEVAGKITRTFLAPQTRGLHDFLSSWMRRLRMTIELDAAGNLRGFYPGMQDGVPRLVIGSHIDTVPDAGAFDGVLGVVLGLALIEMLDGHRLAYGIEIIAFSEEEGVRFGTPFLGSLAVIGELRGEILQRDDGRGTTLEQAIRDYGLDPAMLPSAALSPDTFAYLEFHIEQGPVLEALKLPIGIVDVIAGQSRLDVCFRGSANHAGTTPMHLRRDALAGAAEWIVAVEREALATAGLVATVGKIMALPGAGNVIAAEVALSLDVRHAVDSTRTFSLATVMHHARRIADRRGLVLTSSTRVNQPVVAMDPALAGKLEAAAVANGFSPHRMASGAGHDAMVLARRVPSAMLFLRSPGGISHHAEETVFLEDVAAAIETGHRFLLDLHVI